MYYCKRCGCRLDPADRIPYPGEGDVCGECAEELDREAEHRRLFCLTKEQQKDIKKALPGCRLGTDMDHENRKKAPVSTPIATGAKSFTDKNHHEIIVPVDG